MGRVSKFSAEQIEEIIQLWLTNEYTQLELGKKFGCSQPTIQKILQRNNVYETVVRIPIDDNISKFSSKAKSILWHQDQGLKTEDHKTYAKWKERISFLKSLEGGHLSSQEALVYASKEFPCLHQLFREFDVSKYDKVPSYRPDIQKFNEPAKAIVGNELKDIQIQDIGYSYRDNLAWAMDAAGKYLRTNCAPAVCPNNSAWFLYRQAIENPKDFMTKISQVENKTENPEDRVTKKLGKRTIAELDAMLEELEDFSQEEGIQNGEEVLQNISEEEEEEESGKSI